MKKLFFYGVTLFLGCLSFNNILTQETPSSGKPASQSFWNKWFSNTQTKKPTSYFESPFGEEPATYFTPPAESTKGEIPRTPRYVAHAERVGTQTNKFLTPLSQKFSQQLSKKGSYSPYYESPFEEVPPTYFSSFAPTKGELPRTSGYHSPAEQFKQLTNKGIASLATQAKKSDVYQGAYIAYSEAITHLLKKLAEKDQALARKVVDALKQIEKEEFEKTHPLAVSEIDLKNPKQIEELRLVINGFESLINKKGFKKGQVIDPLRLKNNVLALNNTQKVRGSYWRGKYNPANDTYYFKSQGNPELGYYKITNLSKNNQQVSYVYPWGKEILFLNLEQGFKK